MKVTTDDCRRFLAEFFKSNPQIVAAIYAGAEPVEVQQIQDWAEKPKNWKRESRCRPGKSDYGFEKYEIFRDGTSVKYGCSPQPSFTGLPVNFVWERIFRLEQTEDSVKFVVLEDKDGRLVLGDYVGD